MALNKDFLGKGWAFPFHFDEPHRLRDVLRGVTGLINTYWVRFDHPLFTHEQAVANTKVLFSAAREAGVRRIVHVSITNPDRTSDLPYFRGKAELESALQSSGVSYCILRPTVLFGKEDVLVNNIAWALRHLPVAGNIERMLTDMGAEVCQQRHKRECCGFGGTFCVKQADISGNMVHDKINALLESGADMVLSQDCGCLMNIGGALKQQDSPLEVKHVAQYLLEVADG